MNEKQMKQAVDKVMSAIHASEAFSTKQSKSVTRGFLKEIIEECEMELEGLGQDDGDED